MGRSPPVGVAGTADLWRARDRLWRHPLRPDLNPMTHDSTWSTPDIAEFPTWPRDGVVCCCCDRLVLARRWSRPARVLRAGGRPGLTHPGAVAVAAGLGRAALSYAADHLHLVLGHHRQGAGRPRRSATGRTGILSILSSGLAMASTSRAERADLWASLAPATAPCGPDGGHHDWSPSKVRTADLALVAPERRLLLKVLGWSCCRGLEGALRYRTGRRLPAGIDLGAPRTRPGCWNPCVTCSRHVLVLFGMTRPRTRPGDSVGAAAGPVTR